MLWGVKRLYPQRETPCPTWVPAHVVPSCSTSIFWNQMPLVFLGCCLGIRPLFSLPRLPSPVSAEPRALLIQDAHGEVSAASPLEHAPCEAVETTFLCPKEQVLLVGACFRSTEAVQGGAAHGEPLAVCSRSPLELLSERRRFWLPLRAAAAVASSY